MILVVKLKKKLLFTSQPSLPIELSYKSSILALQDIVFNRFPELYEVTLFPDK